MIRATLSVLGLAIAIASIGLSLAAPNDAGAESDQELMDRKTVWQDNYRLLLRNAALLDQDAKVSRENYARAQRRNYPRGGARQLYIVNAEIAEKKLVEMNKEIEQVADNARRDAIPPHWIYEVDDEPIVLSPPASATGDGNESDEDDVPDWDKESPDDDVDDDREGRNPLYLDD
jgi:hypothetical protein